MSAGSEADERAAFEAWARKYHFDIDCKDRNGYYLSLSVGPAWAAWQERASRADRASAAPTEGVEPANRKSALQIEHIRRAVAQRLPDGPLAMTEELLPWAYCRMLLGYLSAAPTRPTAPDAVEALSDDAMRAAYAEQSERPWTRDEDGTRFKNGWNAARSVLQQIDRKKG